MSALREKFKKINCKGCDMPFCDIKCTTLNDRELDILENIAKEFTMSFGNWLIKNEGSYKLLVKTGIDNSYMRRPMKDILQIFEKETGL